MTRFLIVDDHTVVRRGLNQVLTESFPDAEFGEASTAGEALQLAARERWDIALIDLNLRGRDGLSLLEEMRRLYPQVPALVLSAYPEEEFAVRCLRLGASGYVTKNSAPDELAGAVRKTLSGGRYVTAALAEKLAGLVAADGVAPAQEVLSNRELQVLRRGTTRRAPQQIAAGVEPFRETGGAEPGRNTGELPNSPHLAPTPDR